MFSPVLIKNRFLILFLSLSLSVAFFYLETVHEYFFKFYPHAVNSKLAIEYQKMFSLALTVYLIALFIFVIYASRKQLKTNKKYRLVAYVLMPYLINVIVWGFNEFQTNRYTQLSVIITDLFISSYVIHFVFLIPIMAYLSDYGIRSIIFRNKSELKTFF